MGGLAEKTTQEFIIQICSGVAFIHDQGVAHRDIKPENILLTAEEPRRVKISDFGLAKLVTTGGILNTRCGTPDYMAPEVTSGNPSGYDDKVDSWSVGIIAYEMSVSQILAFRFLILFGRLTKKLPFHRDTQADSWSNTSRTMDFSAISRMTCTLNCE